MNAFKKIFSRVFGTGKTSFHSSSTSHTEPQRLFYAMALGRVAGFFLPLRRMRTVDWQIRPVSKSQQQAARYCGFEFLLDGQAAGCLITSDNSATAIELTQRIAQALATTYLDLEQPRLSCREANMAARIACWLTTTLYLQEILWRDAATHNVESFQFSIGLDEHLLDTLLAQETLHQAETGGYQSYLEHQVVSAYRAMNDSATGESAS